LPTRLPHGCPCGRPGAGAHELVGGVAAETELVGRQQTLEKALTQLVADGVADLEQARLVSLYPKEVEAAPAVPA
jgi:hypothetical protein